MMKWLILMALLAGACNDGEPELPFPGNGGDTGADASRACDPKASASQCARCGALPEQSGHANDICVNDNWSSGCATDGCWVCGSEAGAAPRWQYIAVDCVRSDAATAGTP